MHPNCLTRCDTCKNLGPVYFNGGRLLCKSCVSAPPHHAYLGPFVTLMILAVITIGFLFFVVDFAMTTYAQERFRIQNGEPARVSQALDK